MHHPNKFGDKNDMMLNEESYLELEARKNIYECIRKSPGLHFREIQRRTVLATGSIAYHLHFLHRHGLVMTERRGGFVLYYPADRAFSSQEKGILNLLRQEKIRHIMIYLIENKSASASEMAGALGIAPSNLSWYLGTLLEKNIVSQNKRGRFRFYSVKDQNMIVRCLVAYRASFLDKMVDRFIEAWEE